MRGLKCRVSWGVDTGEDFLCYFGTLANMSASFELWTQITSIFFVTRQTRRYEIIQRDPSRLAVYGRLCCEILGVNFSCQMSQLTKFLFRILWWFPCQPRFLMLIFTFATKLKRLTFLANYLSRWQRAAACWLQSIAVSKRKEIREWILKVSNFIYKINRSSAKEISESV